VSKSAVIQVPRRPEVFLVPGCLSEAEQIPRNTGNVILSGIEIERTGVVLAGIADQTLHPGDFAENPQRFGLSLDESAIRGRFKCFACQ
jgi:hypothetical protein